MPAEPLHAPSPHEPDPRTPDEKERHWFEHVYAGDDMPQLTLRAVAMGMLLGVVMAFSNLYVGLKTGWGLGVVVTACILSYAIFKIVPLEWFNAPRRWRLFDRHRARDVSILENNCMQSTASAAGYSTGSTLVSAFSAYLMITGHHMPFWTVVVTVFFLGMLGVFMAIPMKRNMVNVEQLPFPTGTAAATTLRALHDEGEEARKQARALFITMGIGAAIAWFRDGQGLAWAKLARHLPHLPAWLQTWTVIPDYFPVSDGMTWLSHHTTGAAASALASLALLTSPVGYTLSLECSTILAAAGAIMGFRVALSMFLGAVVDYGVIAPFLYKHGYIKSLGYRGIVSWSVWSGVSMVTSAALVSFFWEWRSMLRAFAGLKTLFGRRPAVDDRMARIEVPMSWFLVGTVLATIACVIVERRAFGIAIPLGLLAVAVSFVLAIVACRATGETDTTPIGPLGKITQLIYGVLIPQNITANLMTANVTSSVAISSADLLTDLKSGYLLGANPRKQFLAQFFGVFVGAIAATAGFYLIVPTADILGGDKFPAPAAQVWKAVAELLARGAEGLPPWALTSIVVGLGLGAVLTVVEKLAPRARRWMPSPVGFGMAFTFPAPSSVSMMLGATAALVYAKKRPQHAEAYTIPVASGFIAGESLMGVAVAILVALKLL